MKASSICIPSDIHHRICFSEIKYEQNSKIDLSQILVDCALFFIGKQLELQQSVD